MDKGGKFGNYYYLLIFHPDISDNLSKQISVSELNRISPLLSKYALNMLPSLLSGLRIVTLFIVLKPKLVLFSLKF